MVQSFCRCMFWKGSIQLQLLIGSLIKGLGHVKAKGWLFGGVLFVKGKS